MKNDAKLDEAARQKVQLERTFLAKHIQKYLHVLDSIADKGTLLTFALEIVKLWSFLLHKISSLLLQLDCWFKFSQFSQYGLAIAKHTFGILEALLYLYEIIYVTSYTR